ncbi:hypothetical protein U1Q18_027367, partial [Sarracenia purpurea var. burkii]
VTKCLRGDLAGHNINLNDGVSEISKSVPDPFHEGISKLSLDLATKASSSITGLAELVESEAMPHVNFRPSKAGNFGLKSIASNCTSPETKEVKKSNEPWKRVSSFGFASTADSIGRSPVDFNNTKLGGIASTKFHSRNLIGECPFTRKPVASESDAVSPCSKSITCWCLGSGRR